MDGSFFSRYFASSFPAWGGLLLLGFFFFPCLVSFCLFVCYCMLFFMGWRNTAGSGLLSVATELEYKLLDLI